MVEILSTSDFYTREGEYIDRVDPAWDEDSFAAQAAEECQALRRVLGEAAGRSVLDCTCGRGGSGTGAGPPGLAGDCL